MAKRSIRDEVYGVLAFVALVWLVFALEFVLPIEAYGIVPRTAGGLVGIVAAPFLHANFEHIVSNTVPLTVLLLLLAGSRGRSWLVVGGIVVLGGLLVWLFGRPANHIGASGLIYGLIAYLMVAGVREGRFVSLVVAVLVGVFYGGALLAGVVPSLESHVSWEGHLLGAIAGGVVALRQAQDRRGAQAEGGVGSGEGGV